MDEYEFQEVARALVQYTRSLSAWQTGLENLENPLKERVGITNEELALSFAQAKASLPRPNYTSTHTRPN